MFGGQVLCLADILFEVEQRRLDLFDAVAVAAGDSLDAGLFNADRFHVGVVGGFAVTAGRAVDGQVRVGEVKFPIAAAQRVQLGAGVKVENVVGRFGAGLGGHEGPNIFPVNDAIGW